MEVDLSTATTEGTRKWIFPLIVAGRWLRRRQIVAWALIAWLLAAPWITIRGHPAVFFDLVNRKIHFLGVSLWVNEMIVFLLFILFVIVSILLLTVVLGRVFCGWACPITVFMEFVYRPIEQLLEGTGAQQRLFRAKPLTDRIIPQGIKWFLFALIAVVLGNTFVAYLMGAHSVVNMIQHSPSENFGSFLFMAISSGIILFQYGWFREQMCLFVCPYGRLQSVMLDKDSLIVAYDKTRGEPRGKVGQATGDCVDCHLCVKVCPTGIDIREGLQLECIHCTACVDACDSIMTKLSRPLGLIRYQTETEVQGTKTHFLRPRLAIYAAVLIVAAGLLVTYTINKKPFRVTLHRESSANIYTTDADGKILNPIHIQLTNFSESPLDIRIEPEEPLNLEVISPEGAIHLQPQEKREVHLILKLPAEAFKERFGLVEVEFKAIDQNGIENELKMRAVGPAS